MTRPKHSPGGFLRYMQMSQTRLFAFTEGPTADRYFYGRMCKIACEADNVGYEVVTASELEGTGGGKNVLLNYFEYLRSTGNLVSNFKGKVTSTIFFTDKDIDDLLGIKIKSSHVVYTRTYDVEGDIFAVGNIARAAAAAASLDELEVIDAIGDGAIWRRECAEKWKEWITLCIFCKRHSIKGTPNYRLTSQVQDELTGTLNPTKLKRYLADIQIRSNMSPEQFGPAYASVKRLVRRIFASGRHEKVFKGKWYIHFLTADIVRIADGRSINAQALTAGVVGALSANLDYTAPWSEHYTSAIRAIHAQVS
jgi:hypothetical protein